MGYLSLVINLFQMLSSNSLQKAKASFEQLTAEVRERVNQGIVGDLSKRVKKILEEDDEAKDERDQVNGKSTD